MAGRVVVHNVGELQNFCSQLATMKSELETKAGQLKSLADELQQQAGSMNSATESQGSNWQDPQYEKLKGEISPVVSAVNQTASSVQSTAGTITQQMAQVESSIQYIRQLISKLNDIS